MVVRDGNCSRESIVDAVNIANMRVYTVIHRGRIVTTVHTIDTPRAGDMIEVAAKHADNKSRADVDLIHEAVLAEVTKFASGLEALFESELFKEVQ